MRVLGSLRDYVRRHLAAFLFGALLIMGANVMTLVLPYLIGRSVDEISGHAAANLGLLLLEFAGATLAAAVLQFGARFVISAASRDVEYDLRNDLFRHFQRLDLAYFQQRKLGDQVARGINDLSAVRMFLGPGVTNLLNTFFAIAATLLFMVSIDRLLTLYTMIMLPLITLTFLILDKRIRDSFKRVQDQFGIVSAQAQENFSGIRVIKAYAQEQHELTAFNTTNREYQRLSIIYTRYYSILWPLMFLIAGLAVAVLIWRGGVDTITGRITPGQFVQFNALLVGLTWPMIALGWFVNLLQQGAASMLRVREVMDSIPAIVEAAEVDPTARVGGGGVELRGVGLRYPGAETDTLDDITVAVPAGTSLAIVGATGAGKSSIVNLITRTFEPTRGAILLDGRPIRDYPLDELHAAIGYVPQEPFLFSLPLAENVSFGRPDASEDELLAATEVAQLSKDVADFPLGLGTLVGERGVSLSGGQKQRAGIARAVATAPRLLILDDALSSVDTNTEAEILRRLRVFMQGRTSIVIAHRISTVKDLDQIIVLDGGRIVERGTHAALVARGGLYTAMYRRQLLGEELALDSLEPAEGVAAPSIPAEEHV